ncbi:unnamed protein product [Lactuca saligna]|uniref:Uncharacterized protein n=1 Tax=Lactuca saligna TaxID=75948 RepID=A0AA36A1N5_LACSI|nr:unnamed protein product [Lactuca saligna]
MIEITSLFCLGGERIELSLADFVIRTKLYLQSDVHIESYIEFIAQCLNSAEEFKEHHYWPNIANGVYQSGTTQESEIRSPLHRFLHRLITNTFNQRQEGDKFLCLGIFYLWSLITSNELIDIPWHVADFLASRAGKVVSGHLCMVEC